MKKNENKFSVNLKSLKISKNLTWAEMAFSLDIKESAILNYAKGRIPNADKLLRLAEIFDVTIDWLLGRSDDPGSALESKSPPELTADEHLDRAVSQILGADIPADQKDEMKLQLKALLLRERKELRHRNFLRNFESLVELALDAAVDRNDQTEAQKLQQQELVRRNRRRRKLNRFEVQQFLYDYGLIKTKTDAVLHRIENEIMKKRDMVTLGELEDYIREECENQLWLENNPSGAQSAG